MDYVIISFAEKKNLSRLCKIQNKAKFAIFVFLIETTKQFWHNDRGGEGGWGSGDPGSQN